MYKRQNVDDADVIRLLKLVTFLPLEQIAEYEKCEGAELNKVKCILAYEEMCIRDRSLSLRETWETL